MLINIALKRSAVNLFNSWIKIYLSWSWSVVTLGYFITTVRAVVVAKLVILGILPLISFILVLRAAVIAKLVILHISSLTSFI